MAVKHASTNSRDQRAVHCGRNSRKGRENNQPALKVPTIKPYTTHTIIRMFSGPSQSTAAAVGAEAAVQTLAAVHTKLSIPEMSPAETPSFDGYVTSAPSSKNKGVVAPRKAEAAQKSTCNNAVATSM